MESFLNRRYPQPSFPGVEKPSVNFEPIRDQRRTPPQYVDIDLSIARSIGANTAALVPIAGNVFYVDQDTTNVGIATVHFQDTTVLSTPITCAPGSIFKVPFTQILVENAAQAGKRLRIIYGTDLDFLPALSSQMQLSGGVSINAQRTPWSDDLGASSFADWTSGIAANTALTAFTAASNVNGAILHRAHLVCAAAAYTHPKIVSHTASPTAATQGTIIAGEEIATSTAGAYVYCKRDTPIYIPAGRGVYFFSEGGSIAGNTKADAAFTLL